MRVKNSIALLVIALATVLAYQNGLHAPFIFDDRHTILTNFGLRDLGNLREVFLSESPGRPFLMFTYAVNYSLGELNPLGYHLINMALQIATSLLLFFLLKSILKEKLIEQSVIPLIVTLYFALHPLATEAVQYVCSRSSLLATMLVLLSFLSFIRGYGGAVLRVVFTALPYMLALLSKEMVATYPIILSFYYFQLMPVQQRKSGKASLLAVWAMLPTYILYRVWAMGGRLDDTPADVLLSPLTYFYTQLDVVALQYIPKLFLPVNLVLDGDSSWHETIFNIGSLAGLCLLLALAVAAVKWFKLRPFLSFSILWFLAALAVTSSFFPIADAYAERRLYYALPAVCLLIAYLLAEGVKRYPQHERKGLLVAIAILIAFGTLTYQRNQLYAEPLKLWEDTVNKSWAKPRVYAGIAYEYLKVGRAEEAEQSVNFALRKYENANVLKFIKCWILGRRGGFKEMQTVLDTITPETEHEEAEVFHLRGVLVAEAGNLEAARELFKKALQLDIDNHNLRINFAMLLQKMGKFDDAGFWLNISMMKYPAEASYPYAIGMMLEQKDKEAAAKYFRTAIKLDPSHVDAKIALARLGLPTAPSP